MARILVVLPYSGAKVGGGLANVNQELTEALSVNHDVKLLTVDLPEHSAPDPERHGEAQIVFIKHPEAAKMVNPGRNDDERNKLYQIINEAPDNVQSADGLGLAGWTPDIIIGHSRFSGPAAIKLRDKFFPKAKVYYFVHSVPAEGVIVFGQGINNAATASDKQALELKWMTQANVIVPVGPLIRLGVMKMLKDGGIDPSKVRTHEFVAGIEMTGEPVEFIPPDLNGRPYVFLMIGRAEAPLKGFQDMILAAMHLRDRNTNIMLRIRGYNAEKPVLEQIQRFVNEVTNPGDEMRDRIEVLPFTTDQDDLRNDVRKAHGILMPSYFEHFGLSPMNGVAFGVPILVNELSGFGMFVNDERRFADLGAPCVVQDFDPTKVRPLGMNDIWGATKPEAFDNRPLAWADAMQELTVNLKERFEAARRLREVFTGYTWQHSIAALVAAADPQYDGRTTLQDKEGNLLTL